MKRLLCIVSSMDTGGAETFLMKTYRQLDKTRYQMDFITVTSEEGHYNKEIKAMGGRIYNVPLHTKHPIRAYNEIKRIVKTGEYKYILKLLGSPVGVIDLYAAKAGGATQLCARSCIGNHRESKVKRAFNVPLRMMLRKISTVKFAPSDLAARYTFGDSAYERGEVVMLHNALDLQTFRYSEIARKKIREELGVTDSYVIGHIGRFTSQKNHEFLIKLFYEVLKRKPEAKLVLVGTGLLQREIKDLCNSFGVSERVVFTGVRDDVPALLSAFDIFVLPSLYEGMPNTCIEAQASGLRCLISDSITRQAAITSNVEYLPISDTFPWIESIMKRMDIDRLSVNNSLIGSKYDITIEINRFIKSVFGD